MRGRRVSGKLCAGKLAATAVVVMMGDDVSFHFAAFIAFACIRMLYGAAYAILYSFSMLVPSRAFLVSQYS